MPRETPLKEQYFEDLRIIDDVTFQKAQEILLANRHQVAGRKPRDASIPRPKLLNGLLYCCRHDRPLIVGAHNGLHMFCPACKRDSRPALYSVLPRELATRRLCQTIADLVRQDTGLVEQVIAACRREIEREGQPDPNRLESLQRQEANLTRNIKFIKQAPGQTDTDMAENLARLHELQAERAAIQRQIAEWQAAANRTVAVPAAAEVHASIGKIGEILIRVAKSGSAAAWATARSILEKITGGKIVVSQQGEAKAKHGWLRGTFRARIIQLLAHQCGCDCRDGGTEVSVDFRDPPPNEVIAEPAKALFDQGMLYKDIARQLNVTRALVIKAIQFWFTSRGLPVPDGRRRRFELEQKDPNAFKFQKIADEALRLCEQGLLYKEIAKRLDCDYTTVSKAIHHAQVQRGLTPIDGRTRASTLSARSAEVIAAPRADPTEPPSSAIADAPAATAQDTPTEGARSVA